jgi:hypothetical protein
LRVQAICPPVALGRQEYGGSVIGSAQLQNRLATLIGVASLVAMVGAAQTAYAQTGGPYTFSKIQYPGSTYTDATGITNSGLVAGTYRDAGGNVHAYTFDGTTYTNVDYPGSVASYGMGISHDGKVLGTYGFVVEGPYHAFILDQGTYTSFDYPGMETDARALNASGNLVGVFNQGGVTSPHGFLKFGENYTQIDFPGALGTETWGLNDAGTISGNYYDAVGIHGFIYAGGSFTAVNFPGASLTRLTRINNLNQAVGWHTQGSRTFGFVVTGGSYRSINYDGALSTVVADINDSGLVVGKYTGPDCPGGCGFVGSPRPGVPLCDQQFTLGYVGGTLTLNFNNLKSSVATSWSTYLFAQSTLLPLWTLNLPAISPAVSFGIPLSGVPSLGTIFGISLMSTPASGIVCADFASVNTWP